LCHRYATQLADKGLHVPAIAVAGGFTFEDQIFKGLSLGAPFVKLVGMARFPIAAAMVGKTIGRAIDENSLPVYVERFGSTRDEIFVTASELRKELGNREFESLPPGAIGLYTYYERLAQGLRQLMAGVRKSAASPTSWTSTRRKSNSSSKQQPRAPQSSRSGRQRTPRKSAGLRQTEVTLNNSAGDWGIFLILKGLIGVPQGCRLQKLGL
jgi:hypothetical protein